MLRRKLVISGGASAASFFGQHWHQQHPKSKWRAAL